MWCQSFFQAKLRAAHYSGQLFVEGIILSSYKQKQNVPDTQLQVATACFLAIPMQGPRIILQIFGAKTFWEAKHIKNQEEGNYSYKYFLESFL